jgi:hypothetical protein
LPREKLQARRSNDVRRTEGKTPGEAHRSGGGTARFLPYLKTYEKDLPAYAQSFLPASVTSRSLKGDVPTVDLVLGYRKSNQSPILKLLLSRLDELVARASKRIG